LVKIKALTAKHATFLWQHVKSRRWQDGGMHIGNLDICNSNAKHHSVNQKNHGVITPFLAKCHLLHFLAKVFIPMSVKAIDGSKQGGLPVREGKQAAVVKRGFQSSFQLGFRFSRRFEKWHR
jgi:hypothetical protein